MRTPIHLLITATTLSLLAGAPATSLAQPAPRALLATSAVAAKARGARAEVVRSRLVAVRPDVLRDSRIVFDLFDDVRIVARRTATYEPRPGARVWRGSLEGEAGFANVAASGAAIAATVYVGDRVFEVGLDSSGAHEVRELLPSAFPSDDPPMDAIPRDALDFDATGSADATATAIVAGDTAEQIDVMVLWTPNARVAAGGTEDAIRSVVDLAVANANTAYANSLLTTRLRLVHAAEVAFTETTSNIQGDLYALQGTSDGQLDAVHTLRSQYAADIVSLIGNGYASAGYCGIGFLMGSPSTSFASNAFNVVDQACAAGNLSFAHEVGHNQGLHHDPPNAGSTPSYSYAYGFQDPGGAFRTVMSYGGATRIPFLSNPAVLYGTRPTGVANSQDNARALGNTASTVANFRTSAAGTPTLPPACSFTVSPTSLSFAAEGGTAQVVVTANAECSWSTSDSADWTTVGPGTSGSGSVTVTAAPNTGKPRSTTVIVAGQSVSVSQKAPAKTTGKGRR